MKKASMYVSALILNLIYLIGETDLVFAQITESDKDYIPGENETSQLITSSIEVRRAVIALIVIAGVALLGLWYYWRRTGQWARARFVEEHSEDLLSKKETTFRKLLKMILPAKNKVTSLGPSSRTSDSSGSADL
tara:strand:+ start:5680 stop:6084 length:405 start_codon:yes stop_codon:yes gene_type:complete